MEIRKILLPTDFSECSNAALDYALFLAEHQNANLDLLHVLVLHEMASGSSQDGFPDSDEIYRRLQELATSEMKGLLEGHGTGHLDVREVQRRAVSAAPGIVDYVVDENVDLVVMGAHGRRGFRRFLLGSVAEEVVRLAPCPVLTIRGTGAAPPIHPARKILVPFDFSRHSRSALAAARELAVSFGGGLELLHVVEPIMEPHPYVPVHYRPEAFDIASLMGKVKEDLGPIVDEIVGRDVVSEIRVLEGHPAWRIAKYADEADVDLIVMATHGRTGLGRFFLGSVTEKVVRTTDCPVLTLKVDADH